ncbi:MAG: hypothetical protein U9O59_07860 [Actinomycetota bacterium]|nr:hypothetical protein [Actinomycetota bacterium]
MKLKLNLKDNILKPRIWIEKIKENREVFVIIITFMFLSFIIFLSEVLDIPHYLLGAPQSLINWREILFLIILIIFVGILAIAGIARGVAERKQNEQLQQVLYNISKSAIFPISLNRLYKTIHKELSNVLDTTNLYIALVNKKKNKISFPCNIDDTKPVHLPRAINHNSLVTRVIRTGKAIFVNQEIIKGKKFMMEFKERFGSLRG